MITKILSKRVELPAIFLIENEDDFKALPKGLPYIIGVQSELKFITIFLEFQVLYRSCVKTGMPIKWLDCLKKIGYGNNIREYTLSSGGTYWSSDTTSGSKVLQLDDFIEEQYIVDFDKLSALKILPVWLDDIRASVEANIIDEVIFDPTAFNKQLGMNIGYGNVKHNMKNLLILDVSGSIPTGVVMTITNLAKLMSKKFYADVMITGGKTFMINYEDVQNSDIIETARLAGRNNEGEMYKAIVEEHKEYNTVIAFGDNDEPIRFGSFGELKPNFKIETIYSLHTNRGSEEVVGYAKHLSARTTHKVKDWVNTINNK